MNPYRQFVSDFADLFATGNKLPLGGLPFPDRPKVAPDAPVALIFSPHPDDECIIGALPLRLLRESGLRIINVAVTLGSKPERHEGRLRELQNACAWLGFDLELPTANGLENINPKTRGQDAATWRRATEAIAALLAKHRPRAIFVPHENDWNSTHIGTHFLVMDALKSLPATFQSILFETEFWGQMTAPNLMVESRVDDVADLLAALSFHEGEVRRNPYHLRLPAWLQDNVRRGAELVGGQGGAAPDFLFATLYRIRHWRTGMAHDAANRRQLSHTDNAANLF
jgi:LmbE family N-acetylglucosaminyl deacetylase